MKWRNGLCVGFKTKDGHWYKGRWRLSPVHGLHFVPFIAVDDVVSSIMQLTSSFHHPPFSQHASPVRVRSSRVHNGSLVSFIKPQQINIQVEKKKEQMRKGYERFSLCGNLLKGDKACPLTTCYRKATQWMEMTLGISGLTIHFPFGFAEHHSHLAELSKSQQNTNLPEA